MINEINIKEAKMYIDNGATILDVRTKEEYDQSHIIESINIDIHNPIFEEEVSKLNKEKSYVVYCASGARSLIAVDEMLKLGFENVHSMAGGIFEWRKEGMEITNNI